MLTIDERIQEMQGTADNAALLFVLRTIEERAPQQVDGAVTTVREMHFKLAAVVERMLERQLITTQEATHATAISRDLEFIDIAQVGYDSQAASLLPVTLARRHRLLVVAMNDTTVTVVMADPDDVLALDDVRSATGLEPVVALADPQDLDAALDRFTRAATTFEDAAESIDSPLSTNLSDSGSDEPVVRFVTAILEQAVNSRVSDVHIEPGEHEVRIRYRIDGVLHVVDAVPMSLHAAIISRVKVLSSLDIAERRLPQNGRITFPSGSRRIDLRVATLPTVWGEKVVLRVLDAEHIDLDLTALDFSERNFGAFDSALRRPHGLVLVTGPTGSGKSTTLYAALQRISSPDVNIITVEDPVEYQLAGVSQMQVNAKAGLTFAAALPAILRSDPDVLLIGEIRDRATAQLAVEAALTGHLVLSTLHTNDAPSAVTRLLEMGIEPYLLGSSLISVLAQRLTRRLCSWCKTEVEPTEAEWAAMNWPDAVGRPDTLLTPGQCRSCAMTGYSKRVALQESMPVSETLERMTVGGATTQDIRAQAQREGMLTLREDGFAKAAAGVTSVAEVMRVTV